MTPEAYHAPYAIGAETLGNTQVWLARDMSVNSPESYLMIGGS